MNPMDKYNQLMNVVNNPGGVDKGLSFGPHGGMFGAYAPSSGINPAVQNPYGWTGVTDNNTGSGFHGSEEHFVEGNPYQQAPAGYVPFNPEWGVDQNPETGNFGLPSSPEGATAGGGAPVMPESPLANPTPRESTPFLDSYMRAREASKAAGPVSKTMSKYLEE